MHNFWQPVVHRNGKIAQLWLN